MRLQSELAAANALIAELETALEEESSRHRAASEARRRAQMQVRRMRSSFSWRVTYPLRVAKRLRSRRFLP
jgi:hypothetical protein